MAKQGLGTLLRVTGETLEFRQNGPEIGRGTGRDPGWKIKVRLSQGGPLNCKKQVPLASLLSAVHN